ncbi:MAG: polysaccharide biosynthesis protein [Coriobacteriia bacterium]|nr:polysaccharide biosynthesis protein [Coriobacteriia bacterium]
MFTNKTLLITGGTGSFGQTVLDKFLDTDIREIRIFSRDETKQDAMRHAYQLSHPDLMGKLKFYLGDVRDISSLHLAMGGVDYVFHAAALKQVPSCEFFPMEAVKTNIEGTDNVITSSISAGVKKIVCLSTDKAAYPINAMGMTKALMEKVYQARSRMVDENDTLICGTRYGNVMCSRGSVIPLFVEQIQQGRPITITSPAMTRFMMTLDEASELVLYALKNANSGDLMVMKAPACSVGMLAEVLQGLFKATVGTKIIGIRHGEKMFETLLTPGEFLRAQDHGDFFCIPSDSRGLNYDNYLSIGQDEREAGTFNSDNTHILTAQELEQKLLSVPYIQQKLKEVGI